MISVNEQQKLILRRMAIESNLELAKKTEESATQMKQRVQGELVQLQRECPHENVVVSGTWQGGGLYYDKAHCKDCNKKGDRYNREFTRKENVKWYGKQFNEEHHAPQYSGFLSDKDW
jgi:hypothetical protein